MSTLSTRVFHFVRQHALFPHGATVLVAASGGGDSSALLSLMADAPASWRLRVHAAHVHHGLRPEADADEAAARGLAERFGLSFACERLHALDPSAPALESRARVARYEALARIAARVGASAVLTGHTLDDQAETVIMRLLRGAGPDALAAMPPVRTLAPSIALARPLLAERRATLRRYLRARAIAWREDASNEGGFAFRNRVRARVLPVLAEENPQVSTALAHLADILRDEAAFWSARVTEAFAAVAEESDRHVRVDGRRFAALPVALQRRLVQNVVDRAARTSGMEIEIGFVHVEEMRRLVTSKQAGREIVLAGGLRARRVGWTMVVGPFADREGPEEPVADAGTSLGVPGRVLAVDLGLLVESSVWSHGEPSPTPPGYWQIELPAAYAAGDLRIRGARAGDRIRLTGMSGHRAVMDLLADAGVPRWDRGRAPVLTVSGEVVWVIGVRAAAAAAADGDRRLVVRAWPLEAAGLAAAPPPPGT